MAPKPDYTKAYTDEKEASFDFDNAFTTVFGEASFAGVGLSIVEKNGTTILGGVLKLSAVGMEITGDLDETQWQDLFKGIRAIKTAYQWYIGDWLLYGINRRYGEQQAQIARICELTGLSDSTLHMYMVVADAWELSTRVESVPFTTYRLIAEMVKDSEQRPAWLQYAIDKKISGRQLKLAIQGGEYQPKSLTRSPLADGTNKKRFNRVFRAIESGKKIKPDDIRLLRLWLDEIEQSQPK